MPLLAGHPALREFLVSLALLAAAYVAARIASLITRLHESAVNFVVMFWARDYAEQGLARTEAYEAVHEGLTAAGIEIPPPTRRMIQE